jgi:hypothetical protein
VIPLPPRGSELELAAERQARFVFRRPEPLNGVNLAQPGPDWPIRAALADCKSVLCRDTAAQVREVEWSRKRERRLQRGSSLASIGI